MTGGSLTLFSDSYSSVAHFLSIISAGPFTSVFLPLLVIYIPRWSITAEYDKSSRDSG